jgi:hypothetical protein
VLLCYYRMTNTGFASLAGTMDQLLHVQCLSTCLI